GNPIAIVKAGVGEEAIRLIDAEMSFLKAAPPEIPGIPKLRSSFQSDRAHALAMDFFPGVSPRSDNSQALETILSSWIDSARNITIGEVAAWQRLEASAGTLLPLAAKKLTSAQ